MLFWSLYWGALLPPQDPEAAPEQPRAPDEPRPSRRTFEELLKLPRQPARVFVFSDMNFNCAAGGRAETDFERARKLYAEHGLELPAVVFWNLATRGSGAPVLIASAQAPEGRGGALAAALLAQLRPAEAYSPCPQIVRHQRPNLTPAMSLAFFPSSSGSPSVCRRCSRVRGRACGCSSSSPP